MEVSIIGAKCDGYRIGSEYCLYCVFPFCKEFIYFCFCTSQFLCPFISEINIYIITLGNRKLVPGRVPDNIELEKYREGTRKTQKGKRKKHLEGEIAA